MRAPPSLGQNFFIFMQFSEKIGQKIGWRPPGVGALAHPLWEILDPPLSSNLFEYGKCPQKLKGKIR